MARQRLRIAFSKDLSEGKTLKFLFESEGIKREGFLANVRDDIVAYENVCRHIPVSLDYGDGEFLTTDGRHFICSTHGAIYEPLTGFCVRGPCEGASLKPLTIEISDGAVWLVTEE